MNSEDVFHEERTPIRTIPVVSAQLQTMVDKIWIWITRLPTIIIPTPKKSNVNIQFIEEKKDLTDEKKLEEKPNVIFIDEDQVSTGRSKKESQNEKINIIFLDEN